MKEGSYRVKLKQYFKIIVIILLHFQVQFMLCIGEIVSKD
ncbi:unnamed protein product [Paramecium octaurelia]|uniref:Uncharacterized protein n=1 Tax=Paramecium octaurelia TaxID=43137 RepID=A0A8S1XHE9_PAROT|nr:unnamed protein product [Paramecium octaurelia]